MLLLSRQYFDEAYRIQVDRANPNELSNARHKTVVNANARSAQTDGGAVKAMDCAQPVSMLLLTLTLFYLSVDCGTLPERAALQISHFGLRQTWGL